MQSDVMANRDIITNPGGMSFMADMDNRSILDVGSITNADRINITTHHDTEPEAGEGADDDITDNGSRLLNKSIL